MGFKKYEITAEAFEFTWQGLKNGLIVGLILNLNAEIKSREKPNQGIKESSKKTLIISLISSPFLMLLSSLDSLLTGQYFN